MGVFNGTIGSAMIKENCAEFDTAQKSQQVRTKKEVDVGKLNSHIFLHRTSVEL